MECPKIAADGPVVTRRAPGLDRTRSSLAGHRDLATAIRRGAVFEDTHFEAGHLRVPLDELERGNWIPFRSLVGGGAFTMLNHARHTALDAERPVSFSETIVSGLLRERWGQEGVLVTDNFSMGAIYGSKAWPRPAPRRSMPGSTYPGLL
jgi:beta-N-acetylhexosaminidase